MAKLESVEGPGELALVMEYVHGATLAMLFELARARGEAVPVRIAVTLLAGVLHGLHAAHETRNDRGEPIQPVNRDVSPHKVLVGADGAPRPPRGRVRRERGAAGGARSGTPLSHARACSGQNWRKAAAMRSRSRAIAGKRGPRLLHG